MTQEMKDLREKEKNLEKAAKKDPDQLFEAGTWAKENGLEKDAKRIWQRVLKFAKDHEAANVALGNEQLTLESSL